MHVAIRADASAALGSGHLRRCLSLASALRACGADVTFVSRPIDAVAQALLTNAADVVWMHGPADDASDAAESAQKMAPLSPDWVVVDHYGLDARWHQVLRRQTGARIAVIDDLADRPLAADVLIDHNLQPAAGAKYANVLQGSPKPLLGPRFALLDAVYAQAARYEVSPEVRSIGIFMGGTDPCGACLAAVRACREDAAFSGPVEVVSSPLGPHHAALAELCSRWPHTRLLDSLPDMAGFFARHDLQVGAGGGATWERYCIGAPTVACIVADNQTATLPLLAQAGAVAWARGGPDLRSALAGEIVSLLGDLPRRRELAERARQLVDGQGAARVAAVLAVRAGAAFTARAAGVQDEALLLAWANDPQVRANAFNASPIASHGHAAWLAQRLADPQACRITIVTAPNGMPVGQVRLDRAAAGWEIGYSMDEAFRGLGLGARLLQAGLPPDVTEGTLLGRVKPGNAASAQVFRRLGFSESTVTDARGEHMLFTGAVRAVRSA